MTHLLQNLQPLQTDPIFAAAARAKLSKDPKIDATIGVILDEEGQLFEFKTIQRALESISIEKGYAPLAGNQQYLSSVTKLVFGKNTEKTSAVATCGGTGALSVILHLAKSAGYNTVTLPLPSWVNHPRLIAAAGLEVQIVTDCDALLEKLNSVKSPTAVLVQLGCHNPTGRDFSDEQWSDLAEALESSDHLLLLDSAYQGLGEGIQEDVAPLKLFQESGIPFMLAWSASKNHGLYGLRTGAALSYHPDKSLSELLQQHLVMTNRAITSVAPALGQEIVAKVQMDYFEEWSAELMRLRSVLAEKRSLLAKALPDFADLINGSHGLFVQIPLEKSIITTLESQSIFIATDGRINIAGLAMKQINELGEKIKNCI